MTASPTLTDTTTLSPEAQREQDIDLVMQAAIEHHQNKEYADAEALYAAVIDADSDHVDANYHMGVLLMQTERPAEAVPHFELVLGQTPNFAQLWIYYFNALVGSKQIEAARAALDLAKQCHVPAYALDTLRAQLPGTDGAPPAVDNSASEATPAPETAQPESEVKKDKNEDKRRASPAEMREFTTLFGNGKIEQALELVRRLVKRNPGHGECWLGLAHSLQRTGRYAESLHAAERAAKLLPDLQMAQVVFANTLCMARNYALAEQHCRQALERFPDCAPLYRVLGASLQGLGRHAEGIPHIKRAVELAPGDALELDALGNALSEHGQYVDAEDAFRRALELAPLQAPTHSNLLFCLMHKENLDAPTAFAEFRKFGERHETRLQTSPPKHANDRDPARRLRVGFVSGDLINHPVAYFFQSVLEHLARDPGLQICIYSNYVFTDKFTQQIREHAHEWHEAFGKTDAELAQQIRNDRIDILIDLSGHTGRNRLVTFAEKPAPVQASWIGNPATTGLTAIDYYMSDRNVTPLDQFASQFSEKLAFLPALAPFKPYTDAPEVKELPALKNGYITFGSFSRLVKIGPEVVKLWARVLKSVPDSRLLIGAISSVEQMTRLAGRFVEEGIDASRVSFMQRKGVANYLEQHNMVDVCLDAFPFAGSTTTMHALWMGVPTVTLPGYSMASRGSTGWLTHLGLQDAFVAQDKDDFVAKCAALAEDLDALATIRRELRPHCMQSPLINADVIANAASRALRVMWQRWCDDLAPVHFEVPTQADQAPVILEPQARAAGASGTASAPITSLRLTNVPPSTRKAVRLVCGTRSSREQFLTDTALGRSLKLFERMPDVELQLFDSNTRGLSTIYNAAIDDAKDNPAHLVFVHDDIWILDLFWAERVRESLARFDVIGLAGNIRRLPKQPSWAITPELVWENRQFLSGSVGHGKGGFPCEIASNFGPSQKDCKLLDGLFLSVDSDTLARSGLRFDEQFEFHFYDMDFCRQAELRRLRMGTWPISVVHESQGAYNSPGWKAGYELYFAKYGS